MLILLFILCCTVTGIFWYRGHDDDWCDFHNGFLVCIGIIGVIITLLFIISTAYSVAGGRVIDAKIQMYNDENTHIEEQLDVLVSQYMKYESDTYKEFKNQDSVTIVSLYPDLKSDELVKKQCDTYVENNNKIKTLKENKINLSTKKWMLYFGK